MSTTHTSSVTSGGGRLSEPGEHALVTGEQTKSQARVDSVWAMLAQMDKVEYLPQEGYRLKKK